MPDHAVLLSDPLWGKRRMLDGLWLKVVGFVFTLIDHAGLFFLNPASDAYVILRSTGRLAMPIFFFLAVEGVYRTRDYWMYFIRLASMALLLDAVAFTAFYGFGQGNLAPGNIFTDLALGTLTVYLLKKKSWVSLSALGPIAYSILCSFSTFSSPQHGFQPYFNMDYGLFGQLVFIGFFLAYEGSFLFLKKEAEEEGVDEASFEQEGRRRFWINAFSTAALVAVNGAFQILWRTSPLSPLVPSSSLGGMRVESWSCLAGVFLLLYDGRPGIKRGWARLSLYLFYPLHLLLFWLASLAL